MALKIRIETSPTAVTRLRPQWEALWRLADGGYVQAPAACLAAWQQVDAAQGGRWMLVTGYEGEHLVALWPLAVRRRGLWRVLSQVGPQAAEFSNMLVAPGADAAARVAAMWRVVADSGAADLATFPFVIAATPLGALLAGGRRVVEAAADIAPYVAWRDGESWEEYYRSLSSSYRKVQNKKRRQLCQQGTVAFEAVRCPARIAELVAWLLRHKRGWADRANKRGAWVFATSYERFLAAVADDFRSDEAANGCGAVVFVLTLDGAPAAAQFAMVGSGHVDWIIAGFDAALSHFSPGSLLNEDCLQWALARGLNVEMGAGSEVNKLFWSRNEAHATVNYRLALTQWGLLGNRAWRLASGLRGWARNQMARRRRQADPAALVPPDARSPEQPAMVHNERWIPAG